jgi:hypothetical protein
VLGWNGRDVRAAVHRGCARPLGWLRRSLGSCAGHGSCVECRVPGGRRLRRILAAPGELFPFAGPLRGLLRSPTSCCRGRADRECFSSRFIPLPHSRAHWAV